MVLIDAALSPSRRLLLRSTIALVVSACRDDQAPDRSTPPAGGPTSSEMLGGAPSDPSPVENTSGGIPTSGVAIPAAPSMDGDSPAPGPTVPTGSGEEPTGGVPDGGRPLEAGGNTGGFSGGGDDGGDGGLSPPAASSGGDRGSGGSLGGDDPRNVALDPALLQACTGGGPVHCELPVDDGNATVTVRVGPGTLRVQAELYRIAAVASGEREQSLTFSVNVRPEQHDGYSAPGGILDLLVEGPAPEVVGLGVAPATNIPTVFIAGDSTVCDWDPAASNIIRTDQRGWAQALTQYLDPSVAVANYADSGETAGSFYTKFFGAAKDSMRAGDYLFIQFGHNDQKSQPDIDGYQDNLMRYVDDARDRDVTPVLFTPPARQAATPEDPGFAGLDAQVRELASNEGLALVDLTALSLDYYAAASDKEALFVDPTHFSEGGASALAELVAQALAQSELPLSAFVR